MTVNELVRRIQKKHPAVRIEAIGDDLSRRRLWLDGKRAIVGKWGSQARMPREQVIAVLDTLGVPLEDVEP